MARRRVSIPTGDKRKNIAVYILVIAILSAFALMRGRAVTQSSRRVRKMRNFRYM